MVNREKLKAFKCPIFCKKTFSSKCGIEYIKEYEYKEGESIDILQKICLIIIEEYQKV